MNDSRFTPKGEISERNLLAKKNLVKRSFQAKTTKRITPSTDKKNEPPFKH